jgi:hypothetical protein
MVYFVLAQDISTTRIDVLLAAVFQLKNMHLNPGSGGTGSPTATTHDVHCTFQPTLPDAEVLSAAVAIRSRCLYLPPQKIAIAGHRVLARVRMEG